MNYAIKLAYLPGEGRWHTAGPHNYYIFVLGNSGIAALFALLLFMANMVYARGGGLQVAISLGPWADLILAPGDSFS